MIGREKEQRVLRELAESDHSQLAVVYGRRRVGKTYMIRETFQYRFTFSHTGVEGGTAEDELYDLESDPGELVNRATDPACQERIVAMRKRLHSSWKTA